MNRKISMGKQQGMALIEGLIAVLIFSLGILSIVGLQAVNLKQAADAKYRVDASFLANQTLGMMWADRGNLISHAVTDQAVAGLPNGKRTVAVAGSEVTVTITWQLPGEQAPHRHVVVAQISG
jgi:type IV pilus assembly protein PilV